jgi:hypothetical protein
MKKLLTLIAIVPLTVGGVALATPQEKHNICHATSSESNPWEAISVADNNTTHENHDDDFPYGGPTKDNGQPTKDGDEWCEANAPKPPQEEPPVEQPKEQPKVETKVDVPAVESEPVVNESEFVGGK